MLEWIARFRFVTSEILADRFGLSPQRVNARLRRLEQAGLIAREPSRLTQPRAVYVTGRGARRLGLRPRRAPRTDAQRDHELAIARLVAHLEQRTNEDRPRPTILTEREQRTKEASGEDRFSVGVRPAQRNERRRWPDLVLDDGAGHRTAIEIELSTKAPERLRRIVAGYATTPLYQRVRFVTRDPRLEQRIATLIKRETNHRETNHRALASMLGLPQAVLAVEPIVASSPPNGSEPLPPRRQRKPAVSRLRQALPTKG